MVMKGNLVMLDDQVLCASTPHDQIKPNCREGHSEGRDGDRDKVHFEAFHKEEIRSIIDLNQSLPRTAQLYSLSRNSNSTSRNRILNFSMPKLNSSRPYRRPELTTFLFVLSMNLSRVMKELFCQQFHYVPISVTLPLMVLQISQTPSVGKPYVSFLWYFS